MGQKMPRIVTDSERIIVLEKQIKKIIADHNILQACVNAHAEGLAKLQRNTLQLAQAFTVMQQAFEAISDPTEDAKCH